jgi:hypothetical protein
VQAYGFRLPLEEKILQGFKIRTCVAMLLFCANSSALTQGSPSLITDDTGTSGNNNFYVGVKAEKGACRG